MQAPPKRERRMVSQREPEAELRELPRAEERPGELGQLEQLEQLEQEARRRCSRPPELQDE
jgi:hypothetical protein